MAKEDTEIIYGLRASLAVFGKRPTDILRVATSRTVRDEVSELSRWATGKSVPCAETNDSELDRMADSSHHEGVCILTKPRKWTTPAELADLLVRSKGLALALDRVRNPYNIGAILRTAAFFGVDAVLIAGALAPQAVRVAEGGAEHVLLSRTTDIVDTLGRLRAKGVRVVGTDSKADQDQKQANFSRPVVVVMGHEREGISDRMRAQCDQTVALRGSGSIESLNVSVAAGVLIAEITGKK